MASSFWSVMRWTVGEAPEPVKSQSAERLLLLQITPMDQPGRRKEVRRVARLFGPEDARGIETRRPVGWNHGRDQRNADDERDSGAENHRIRRADLV